MSDKQKIGDDSLVDRLVGRIHDAILSGDYSPGSHIGIKKVADTYGVSMIPVREALARLLASRLVRVENNRGYFVAARPTPSQFRQFVEARELFETSVIGLGFENATAEDLKLLRALNRKMKAVAGSEKSDRMVKWSRLNVDFHQALVALARNEYLSNQYSDLSFGNLHVQLVQSFQREFVSLELLVVQHEEMIDALEQQNRELFFSLLSNHIRNVIVEE